MSRTAITIFAALALAPAAPALAQPAEPEPETSESEPVPVPVPVPVPDPVPVAAVEEWTDDTADESTDTLQIHGWVSQGAAISTGNNYLMNSKRGSLEFFETGLNVTKEIGTNLRAGIQLFAQDMGPIGNYDPIIDWAYVDYKVKPWLGVRAGHFKMPLYLRSEQMDADMSRTTVLMPQAVYDQHFRDVLAAVSGVDLYGTVELGGAGSLDYDAYLGTVYITPHVGNFDMEHVAGGRAIWNTPVPCLRAAGHLLYANFHELNDLPDGTPLRVSYNDWTMAGGALECATEKLTVTVEASLWQSELTFDPMVQEPYAYQELRAYAQVEYRATDRISGSLYSSIFRDESGDGMASGDDEHQYDTAASVRFDITPNLLVKAEAHLIDGYALTEGDLNPGEQEHRWGMFLAKTTLTF